MPGFIPWRKVDLWLQSFRTIWVATTRPDGRPHAAPVWYWWDGRDIYFTSDPTSQKAKNLAHQPWVIVHAGDGDDTIILEGPAALITDPAQRSRIETFYRLKYVDPHSGAQADLGAGTNLYHVRVRHVMVWEYGVVATRTDWRFDDQA